jgi:tripartite-type tricarboxylate transporter receptor subunit TctC
MLTIKVLSGALVAALLLAGGAPIALAQSSFPTRPVRLLVPFAPGGGVDVVARVVAQKLSERLGQPILIESKPGAGGAIAVNELLRSDPDGHTLLVTTSSHATMPTLSKLPWHPSNDFAPIANIYSTMFVMPTNSANASKFRTLKEFVSYAHANPGKISWGSSGIGGPLHLIGAQFGKVAKIDMVHVPYRGNGPMLQALLANEVQLTFDTPTLPFPHIQDGKLIALAVTGERRLPKIPDIPTVRESGIDYAAGVQVFVIGPKAMPEPVQARLNKAFVETLNDKQVNDRLTGFGLQVAEGGGNTVAALKKHIDDFAVTYGKLIADLGIKAE